MKINTNCKDKEGKKDRKKEQKEILESKKYKYSKIDRQIHRYMQHYM